MKSKPRLAALSLAVKAKVFASTEKLLDISDELST